MKGWVSVEFRRLDYAWGVKMLCEAGLTPPHLPLDDRDLGVHSKKQLCLKYKEWVEVPSK